MKPKLKMKMLMEFLDGLVKLVNEENKVKAVLAKEKFVNDFGKKGRKAIENSVEA